MPDKEFTYDSIEVTCADLKIIFITDDKTTVTGTTDVHMHSFWEFFYLHEGTLTVTGDTEKYVLHKNQGLIIPPNIYHNSESNSNVLKKSIFFTFEKIKSSESDQLFNTINSAFMSGFHLVNDPDSFIDRLLSLILEGYDDKTFAKIWRIRSNISELIFCLYDSIKNAVTSCISDKTEQNSYWVYKYAIDRLLDIYYMTDISLEQLGEKLYLSPQTVARIISSAYGKSFNELKLELKMRNAKRMLKETSLSVNEIGKKTGYTTQRGFLAAFSKYEGCTPSEYRKQTKQ